MAFPLLVFKAGALGGFVGGLVTGKSWMGSLVGKAAGGASGALAGSSLGLGFLGSSTMVAGGAAGILLSGPVSAVGALLGASCSWLAARSHGMLQTVLAGKDQPRLPGVQLSPEEKKKFGEIASKLSELGRQMLKALQKAGFADQSEYVFHATWEASEKNGLMVTTNEIIILDILVESIDGKEGSTPAVKMTLGVREIIPLANLATLQTVTDNKTGVHRVVIVHQTSPSSEDVSKSKVNIPMTQLRDWLQAVETEPKWSPLPEGYKSENREADASGHELKALEVVKEKLKPALSSDEVPASKETAPSGEVKEDGDSAPSDTGKHLLEVDGFVVVPDSASSTAGSKSPSRHGWPGSRYLVDEIVACMMCTYNQRVHGNVYLGAPQ